MIWFNNDDDMLLWRNSTSIEKNDWSVLAMRYLVLIGILVSLKEKVITQSTIIEKESFKSEYLVDLDLE